MVRGMLIASPLLIHDCKPYKLTARPGAHDPAEYHVTIRDGVDGRTVLSILGDLNDLHGLFLGLHTVLVDAGRTEREAQLVIPGHAAPSEAPGE